MEKENKKSVNKKKSKQLKKLNVLINKKFKLLNIIIFIIVLIFGYFFLISHSLKNLSDLRSVQYPEKLEELKVLEEYEQKMNKLQTLVNSYQATHFSEISKLALVLPTKAEIPELIAQTDALALASGFRISSLEILEEEIDLIEESSLKDLNAVSIALILKGGNYLDFKSLLYNIESNVRVLDLISIGFDNSGSENEYNLVLRTYYIEEDTI